MSDVEPSVLIWLVVPTACGAIATVWWLGWRRGSTTFDQVFAMTMTTMCLLAVPLWCAWFNPAAPQIHAAYGKPLHIRTVAE
jgi:hypothetical protein